MSIPGKWILIFGIFLSFLGVASLLAALIVPRMKACPYCQSSIPYTARVCAHCGREQELPARAAAG